MGCDGARDSDYRSWRDSRKRPIPRQGLSAIWSLWRQSSVEQAIESYDSFFEQGESQAPVASELDTEFVAAWEMELGTSIQAFLAFLIRLEQIALEANREVIDMPRSRLVTVLSEEGSVSELKAATTLEFVTSAPRPSWFQVPVGYA